jgi:hexosaminidase
VVSLSAQGGGEVRYTTDGSEPTASSALYAAPLPAAGAIRAALFLDGVRIGPTASWTPAALRLRHSQDLKLCNDKLGLNLEGAPGEPRRTYLINPADPCWSWPAADLAGVGRVTVAFERLPFNLGMDPAHNTVMVHPPRRPAGELEVREDSCLTDPVAVAEIPPGAPGTRSTLTLALPPRAGRHDLCFTFTGSAFEPVKALATVELGPAAP